jgi:hypothetical protein
MQFQVPQFIEVEDKIFGPLTASQFIYVVGGVGFAIAMWVLLPLWAAIILGAPVALLGLALAFYQINNRPLITFLEAGFQYIFNSKLYIWEKKKEIPKTETAPDRINDPAKFVPAATANRLKDLAWSLDIKESIYTDQTQK